MVMPFKPSAAKPSPERGSRSPAVLAWIHLLRAYMKIDRLIEQRLRSFGLTHPQFGLLNQLSRSHGPTQQECSHALYVDKANLSGIVDRLSRTGLVDRIPAPGRRRNSRTSLGGRAVSLVGTWMQITAQSWVVWEISHSSAALGIVGMFSFLPILLLGPLAGVPAARLGRGGP